MDDLDRNILTLLGADARMSVATLARRLKVARSTIQARLERLETNGTIAGYTLKLGEAARVNVTPSGHWPQPVVAGDVGGDRGPVLVTLEYDITAEHRPAFQAAMAVYLACNVVAYAWFVLQPRRHNAKQTAHP